MKSDELALEDLTRRANSALPGPWRVSNDGLAAYSAVLYDDGTGDVYEVCSECTLENASHIAANSPPVTLALIARIRELETDLCSLTSLYAKAQHDLDFFREQAKKCGGELRGAQSEIARLSSKDGHPFEAPTHVVDWRQQCENGERTIARLSMKIKRLEAAGKSRPPVRQSAAKTKAKPRKKQ